MAVPISLLATVVSLVLAIQVTLQYASRQKPYQLAWAVALFLFAIGTGAQATAELVGWSPLVYRIWYLSGAILTAAYLGQGTMYLLAKRRTAHIVMAVLLLATVYAVVRVFTAPVDLTAALAEGAISGGGMPQYVRILTPFFNIYGTLLLVGGAALSVWRYFWNGGSGDRALGTALIAIGSLVVASGGTLARFNVPQPLYVSELAGVILIFIGFRLTGSRRPVKSLDADQLKERRRRVTRIGVGVGAGVLLSAVVVLPILPFPMGIATEDAQHVYIDTLPEENKGAYLITDQGVMQLYGWSVQPDVFPDDAPTLPTDSIEAFAVVQKQFMQPDQYQLLDVTTGDVVPWARSEQKNTTQLFLYPAQPLTSGDYAWRVATDSMFGGSTWHYFHLN